MKRGLAIFFLLVANIILLAHAAVPHHYNEGIFCYISTTCQSACDDHEHEDHQSSHQHQHDGEQGHMECELKPMVIIPNNINPKQEIAVIELNHLALANFNGIQVIDHNSNHYLNHLDLKRKIPMKLSLYRIFINNSTGLRAPPSFV